MDNYADVYANLVRLRIEKLKRKDPRPHQVTEFLYIGSAGAAFNLEALQGLRITHVISICEHIPPAFPDTFTYLVIPVEDSASTKVSKHFKTTNLFIKSAANSGGKVLVHCLAGVSRSATVVLAYLMKHQALSLDDAFRFLRASRPCINPNFGFIAQLKKYDEFLRHRRRKTK